MRKLMRELEGEVSIIRKCLSVRNTGMNRLEA
jgi:hypothetical protein